MPHAMTEALTIDDTITDAARVTISPVASVRSSAVAQQECETPNERAMRTATAARRAGKPGTRQQG